MEREELERILVEVREGRLSVDEAQSRLRLDSLAQLEFATLDLQRAVRRGFPEVVLGRGKTDEQLAAIVDRMHREGQTVLVTRVDSTAAAQLVDRYPEGVHHPLPGLFVLRAGEEPEPKPGVLVVTGGTGDLPVAEEAAITAETLGQEVERLYDVGVAGLHRLLAGRRQLVEARVIVVVAGMEGALPSVVAGLTDVPVIGVPTSNGYGTGDGGRAALLAMLNACAAGLTVVNIDNGFGAGYAAALVNRRC